MAALERYARQAREAIGMRHLRHIESLRWYIRNTPIDEFTNALRHITDVNILKTLQEAGCEGEKYTRLVERVNELLERREGR